MPEFTVHFDATVSASQTVEADTAEDAIDVAFETGGFSGGLCVHCSGYDRGWGKEEGEYEPTAVTNENGETVWSDKPEGVQP